MHPITKADINTLIRYNLRNREKIGALIFPDKQYYRTWVNKSPVFLRKEKTDILVFKKIFIDKEYDFPLRGKITNIIDAGANVGLSSLFFAQKFPDATILAIEPEQSNFELLKKNTAGFSNIIPILGGISNHSGNFKIKNTEGDHWNFMLEPIASDKQADGKLYSVTDLMKEYGFDHVDFFKIDIEGGETELFTGDNEWISLVKWLSIELHDFIVPSSSNTFIAALNQHTPYSISNYGENMLVEFHHSKIAC